MSIEQRAVDFAGDRSQGAGHGYPSWEARLIEKGYIQGAKDQLRLMCEEDKFDQSLDAFKQALEDKYPEQTKCYCGHTTYCDCGPEQSPEEETLQKIKVVLLVGNDAQAIRLLEQYGAYMQELVLASKERS